MDYRLCGSFTKMDARSIINIRENMLTEIFDFGFNSERSLEENNLCSHTRETIFSVQSLLDIR